MSAFAFFPREISPDEVGLCAVRIFEPVTPRERALMANHPGTPLWRVTIWFCGRVFLSSSVGHEVPSIVTANLHRSAYPEKWVEIVRANA